MTLISLDNFIYTYTYTCTYIHIHVFKEPHVIRRQMLNENTSYVCVYSYVYVSIIRPSLFHLFSHFNIEEMRKVNNFNKAKYENKYPKFEASLSWQLGKKNT